MMRRPFALALAMLLGFAAPAFAQNSNPVLGGQNQSLDNAQGGPVPDGQDALAQDQDGGALPPLLLAGGVLLGTGVIIFAATQAQNDNPTSP